MAFCEKKNASKCFFSHVNIAIWHQKIRLSKPNSTEKKLAILMKNSQAGTEKQRKTADFVISLIFFQFNASRSHVFEDYYKPFAVLDLALQYRSFDTHIDIF